MPLCDSAAGRFHKPFSCTAADIRARRGATAAPQNATRFDRNDGATTMRMLVLAATTLVVTVGIAQAQAPATPDSENGRYSFTTVPDGVLRLDTRTGQVSLCAKQPAGWACNMVPDERSALEN